MLRRFFIHIIRKIYRNKIYSVINLLGLSVGLTCAILAFLYVQDEWSYDKHFSDTANTYRLLGNNFFRSRPADIQQPARFMDEILKSVPEIQSGIRVDYSEVNIEYNHRNQIVRDAVYADSNFFEFFNWPMIQGNSKTALTLPNTIVLSESKAYEYFKNEDPVGQILKINNVREMTVTGVFKDIPKQSHIRADVIISYMTIPEFNPGCFYSWGCFACNYYLKSVPGIQKEILDKKLTSLWNSIEDKNGGATGENVYLELQKFSDIYLKSRQYTKRSQFGSFHNVLAIGIISIFILVIVSFNFVNLTTALYQENQKEIVVSKMLGAGKKILALKIVTEILIYLAGSLIMSLIATSFLLPVVNNFTGKDLSFFSGNPINLIAFIGVLLLAILLLTSIYPILVVFKQQYISGSGAVARSGKSSTVTKQNFRNSLVVTQFSFGIILILLSVLVNKQLKFIRHKNLGFDKEQLVVVVNPWEFPLDTRYEKFKESLKKYPHIKSVSAGANVPCTAIDNWSNGIGTVSVDYNYFETLGTDNFTGRDFNNDVGDENSIIITRSLLEKITEEQYDGETPSLPFIFYDMNVIAVVDDMEFTTIHYDSKPALFYLKDSYNYSKNIIIRLAENSIQEGLTIVKKEWQNVAPSWPVEYYFMDEQFAENYLTESQTSMAVNTLTAIALFLSCLGLYGLALFTINGRVKEIGIRKVNGAKIFEIVNMLNREYITWVISAFVIASPLAWFAMKKWLENFVYKTDISWWIFALAGLTVFGLSLITVSWQSWRAAVKNPVEALRYE